MCRDLAAACDVLVKLDSSATIFLEPAGEKGNLMIVLEGRGKSNGIKVHVPRKSESESHVPRRCSEDDVRRSSELGLAGRQGAPAGDHWQLNGERNGGVR